MVAWIVSAQGSRSDIDGGGKVVVLEGQAEGKGRGHKEDDGHSEGDGAISGKRLSYLMTIDFGASTKSSDFRRNRQE